MQVKFYMLPDYTYYGDVVLLTKDLVTVQNKSFDEDVCFNLNTGTNKQSKYEIDGKYPVRYYLSSESLYEIKKANEVNLFEINGIKNANYPLSKNSSGSVKA